MKKIDFHYAVSGKILVKSTKKNYKTDMNPLSIFKKNRSLTRAQDLTDWCGLTHMAEINTANAKTTFKSLS
jgi:hypothetical protein